MRTFFISKVATSASCLVVATALASPPQFVLQWGTFGRGPGDFYWPIGITQAPGGGLWVADSHNARVQRFGPNGEFLASWGRHGGGSGEFLHPDDVAIGADGSVFVSDPVRLQVQRFTADGQFLAGWPIEGYGLNELATTLRIAAADDALFVADARRHRVLKFDPSGLLLDTWGHEGSGAGEFRQPIGIVVVGAEVLVADSGNGRVQRFALSGDYLGSIAPEIEPTWKPAGIAVDDRGRLLVTDAEYDRVFGLTASGEVIARWGGTGSQAGEFYRPYGIAAGPGGAVYVTDHDNHRVQMFRFEPLGVREAAWSEVKSRFR